MNARRPAGEPLRVSVIIPAWRDFENLRLLLPRLAHLPGLAEIVVANASRTTRVDELTAAWKARLVKISPPNRGAQMNAGAKIATGDVLLFQHADTDLKAAHLTALERALQNPAVVGGAFYRKFDRRHPRLRWLEPLTRFLSRNGGTLYGDQSIFVRREIFERLGGFAEIPLMEDVEFSKRLRRAGRIALLDPPVESSSRHHERHGAWRTTMRNALFLLLYHFGVSPFRLHAWYYPAPELSQRGSSMARPDPSPREEMP